MGVQEATSRDQTFWVMRDQLRGHLAKQPQNAEHYKKVLPCTELNAVFSSLTSASQS